MNWLTISTVAYFLLALEVILNKFLLSSKRVSHPVIYTFYAGATGLFALVFSPFGFHLVEFSDAIFRFAGGTIFIFGMLAFFLALDKGEASRVTPVVGAVVPITIFFLSMIFLGERLSFQEMGGLLALVFGGLWISYDLGSKKKFQLFPGFFWSVLAGVLLAISATIFKNLYIRDNFLNVYIWTRVGAFLGILIFFLVPRWKKILLSSLSKFKKPGSDNKRSGMLFILARSLGGGGSILKEKATSLALASVTLVNALVSLEYVFIFVLGVLFSLWLPGVFVEKKDWKSIGQKILAILIITAGFILISGNN